MPEQVLYICQRPPYPPNKGEKLRTYYQIKHLVGCGFKICVACPVKDDEDLQDLLSLKAALGVNVLYRKQRSRLVSIALALLTFRSISEQTFYNPTLNKLALDFANQEKILAVIYSASSLIRYVQSVNVDRYMDFMDLDSDKWAQYSTSAGFPMNWVYRRESKFIKKLEYTAVTTCRQSYLISQNEIDLLNKTFGTYKGDVRCIGNGISDEEFFPPDSRRIKIENDPRFLFVGVMDYKPNEEAVLWFCEHVFPEIKSKYKRAVFQIVGMNPSSRVQRLANADGVEVTGKVDSVLPYFHDADVFVAPFHLARGVQNKILQSFSCGLPVVTTAMGIEGITGNVEKCSRVCATPDEFVQTITTIVEDDFLRQSMSAEGINLIESGYSWSAQLKDFLSPLMAEVFAS